MKKLLVGILIFSNIYGCVETPVEISIQGNPAEIFDQGLSHGIGESVLDSPLLNDSLNARILIFCRNGINSQKLQKRFSDIKDLDNRLNSLIQAKILYREEDQYYVSFPIIIGKDHKRYFRLVNRTVDKIYPAFLLSLNEILNQTEQRGWKQWSYHIIWSLIFDSQFSWYEMADKNLVPPLNPAINWVIYPQSIYKTGTNYYPDTELRDFWVVVSWSPNGSNTLGLVGGSWELVYNSALGDSSSLNNNDKVYLRQLGLMNNQEEVTFPVIYSEDTFYNDLKVISNTYLSLLEENLPNEKFSQIIGRDEKYSWAIAYHNISWEILDRLINDNIISQPDALKPKHASSEAIQMTGVCSVISVYQPFVDQIMEAFAD